MTKYVTAKVRILNPVARNKLQLNRLHAVGDSIRTEKVVSMAPIRSIVLSLVVCLILLSSEIFVKANKGGKYSKICAIQF